MTRLLFISVLCLCSGGSGRVSAQGSLTPPGPPAPTMKTLSQVEPRHPIGALPFHIAMGGSYYLTTNLMAGSATNGIQIDADDVTLDLGGFTLNGAGQGVAGILVPGPAKNVTVRNGVIRNWQVGVEASLSFNCQYLELKISDNATNGLVAGADTMIARCSAHSNGGIGISADQNSTVKDSHSTGNSLHGIYVTSGGRISGCTASFNLGTGIVGSNSCLISASTAVNNLHFGIHSTMASQIENCVASLNQISGISAGDDATVTRCLTANNQEAGIRAGANATVQDCKAKSNGQGIRVDTGGVVRGCTAQHNRGDGIEITSECVVSGNVSLNNFNNRDAAGIRLLDTDNHVKDNILMSNVRGISADVGGSIFLNNSAANNTLNYFLIGVHTVGPVFSGTNTLNATNPVTNFEF